MSLLPSCPSILEKKTNIIHFSEPQIFAGRLPPSFRLVFSHKSWLLHARSTPQALPSRMASKGEPFTSTKTEKCRFFPTDFFWAKKNGGVAKCLGRNSGEDGFFRFGKFCVLANLLEMLKELGYFGSEFLLGGCSLW